MKANALVITNLVRIRKNFPKIGQKQRSPQTRQFIKQ